MRLLTANNLQGYSQIAWNLSQFVNRKIKPGTLPTPAWAPGRLLKTNERVQPPLGLPRITQSLCPYCNERAARETIAGERTMAEFANDPGFISAELLEEAGKVLMRKICPDHGPFEDVVSSDVRFYSRMEQLYQGRDFACTSDEAVHRHGAMSIKYGRGVYLVIDLTNRCNMKCTPCFMDANQVGYVHELDLCDIEEIFRRANSFKPHREINVLFSGGEPTLHPQFLEILRLARRADYNRLHVATNGIRFAQEPSFAVAAHEAGLHGVFLQFDGVTEQQNRHRGVGNLLEVKLEALRNIARAGMLTTLQASIINGINNNAVGDIFRFAVENIDKVRNLVLQPISFAGRDAHIEDQLRYARRYTTADLARDLQEQTEADWQPLRDWFPISAWSSVSRLIELMDPAAARGPISTETHPTWMVASALVVNKKTKVWSPVTKFFDLEQFMRDSALIRDSARGPMLTRAQMLLSVGRNFHADKAPEGFGVDALLSTMHECISRTSSGPPRENKGDWTLLITNGMWFQDLFNYDTTSTEASGTPIGTQEGEIPFCSYNSGNWRKIVEAAHQTATLSEWNKSKGRHTIYTNGKLVSIAGTTDEKTVTANETVAV